MKIHKRLIFWTVIFICSLVYFAPASIIQKFLSGNIIATGISGTLWKGNVRTIVVDQVNIQNISWSANPMSLFTGKIQANISINSSNLKGQFETIYTKSAVQARNLLLNGNLSLLMPYFEKYGLTISGQFDANFERFDIKNGIPQKVSGTLQMYDTSILGIFPLNLGDITSIFRQQTQGQGARINLNNDNGELNLNGIITIDTKGAYLVDLTFSRNASTSKQVLRTVQILGRKVDENSAKLTYSGQLDI